jgi:ribosomal-protein-alanine N-acetyltransferase
MKSPDIHRHVSILWATPEHAQELAALHASLFKPAWDEPNMRRLLEHPGSAAFLARLGSQAEPAGFILGQIAADEAEILSLGVRAERQRHGIGRLLVGALARAVKKTDVRRLFLEVANSNVAAVALYEALGFQAIGRRKAYYAKSNESAEDAVTLSLTL